MSALDIGRVTVFAVVTAFCAVMVRKQTQEIAVVLTLAGVTAILGYCLQIMVDIREIMVSLMDLAQISPTVAAPVFKTVGIAVLTHFGAEVCKDAREGGLAAAVEMAGAAAALCLAVPLLQVVLDMIAELL